MKMNKEIKRVLKAFLPLFVLLGAYIIQWTINKTYLQTVITGALLFFVMIYLSFSIVGSTKGVFAIRHDLGKKIYYPIITFMVVLSVFMTGVTTLQAVQLTHPVNIYTANESHDPEPETIYVTHNTECEYCNASYRNMLRAVRGYSQGHIAKIQVVNLNDDTRLAKKLNELVDHYGSIVKIDKNGTLHEVMYTTADKDENPISNTPTDIYNRIAKVENDD